MGFDFDHFSGACQQYGYVLKPRFGHTTAERLSPRQSTVVSKSFQLSGVPLAKDNLGALERVRERALGVLGS